MEFNPPNFSDHCHKCHGLERARSSESNRDCQERKNGSRGSQQDHDSHLPECLRAGAQHQLPQHVLVIDLKPAFSYLEEQEQEQELPNLDEDDALHQMAVMTEGMKV